MLYMYVGVLPPEYSSLRFLEWFYFDQNQISSTLPSSYVKLDRIMQFSGMDNYLVGTLPKEYGTPSLSI